ncbi:F5/8 type C domain-containing protein [Gemmatirosa kalamazoonensis]|uniref:F5/8 type C domain-containing protein n=1 Tax=Gemmatirosa kalamazoonensis TaxID=861299 RepID=W0RBH2_9BACT|nr:hypothetical protein [Gemmatirosa kalamazoonensis]AHG88449.1 F5/8 type C domain-containing protein [Gemmatirosa kalamazoonensis]
MYLQPPAVVITIDTAHMVRQFDPRWFFGGGVDGRPEGDARRTFTPPNVAAMQTAGLPRLSYRLRTELGIEAWHWNPRGTWSDPAHRQGYWTSSTAAGAPITESYGYNLPRRGTTYDQANNEGYSRLTDGDTATFWKSNPYLDHRYTGEPDSLHPQRAILDLGAEHPVNAIRLRWGAPWAVRYVVERWVGDDSLPPDDLPDGDWEPFPLGTVSAGRGGDVTLRLADAALPTRWIRITLLEGSRTAPAGARDPRDSIGFALKEVGAGALDPSGRLVDVVRHAPSHDQTTTWVTSTDPWHRAVDRDAETEQPGVDRVEASGLTSGLPMLVPVGVLYDTPQNGAALLRYLRRRYRATHVELGEEPDGQYARPADYGALALEAADALRRVDSAVVLGGPSFQSVELDVRGWPDEPDSTSWLARVRDYVTARGRARDFAFVSFEWYPFDAVCDSTAPQLRAAPSMLRDVFERLGPGAHGLPWVISEYGYSAFAGPAEVQMGAALLDPDIVGTFLTLGGDQAYLYGYEPADLQSGAPRCERWGNNALFLADSTGRARWRTAVYHTMRMTTRDWVDPDGGVHALYRAATDLRDSSGAIVTAYPLRRPDGRWSLLLVNKDSLHAYTVRLRLAADTAADGHAPSGPLDVVQFSAAQYAWREDGPNGRPTRSDPPARFRRDADALVLPGYSVTVVRF